MTSHRLATVTQWLSSAHGVVGAPWPLTASLLGEEHRWYFLDEFVDRGRVAWLGLLHNPALLAAREPEEVFWRRQDIRGDVDSVDDAPGLLPGQAQQWQDLVSAGSALAVVLETHDGGVSNHRIIGAGQWLSMELLRRFDVWPRHLGTVDDQDVLSHWRLVWPHGGEWEPTESAVAAALRAAAGEATVDPRGAAPAMRRRWPTREASVWKRWRRHPHRGMLRRGTASISWMVEADGPDHRLTLLADAAAWQSDLAENVLAAWMPELDHLCVAEMILMGATADRAAELAAATAARGWAADLVSRRGRHRMVPTPLFAAPLVTDRL